MTAINIICQKDRILILTDGAIYNADGIVVGFGPKVIPMVNLRAAMAARGSVLAGPIFSAALADAFTTFDDLVTRGGEVMEQAYDHAFYNLAQSGETEIEILVTGFSESRDQAETYVASSIARSVKRTFHFTRTPAAIAAPDLPSALFKARGFRSQDDVCRRFDPARDGLWMLEQQRRRKCNTTTGEDRPQRHIVGGFAQLTEVRRTGSSQKILKRWPDKVGQLISVSAEETVP